MRQEQDGRWRAVADGHPVEVVGEDVRDCLRKVHQEALTVLPAVSWESGPPVVLVEVLPRLVGVAEAAEIMGWDKRRVATYIRRESFPEPLAELAGGRVWAREDIVQFREAFLARQRPHRHRLAPRSRRRPD
jgi:16S rRNA C967 or C1407 C5-methylase (RsmB/RsmF family)